MNESLAVVFKTGGWPLEHCALLPSTAKAFPGTVIRRLPCQVKRKVATVVPVKRIF